MGNTYPKEWIHTDTDHLPARAVHAGHDSDGSPIYVCSADHKGDSIPGKFIGNRKEAFVAWHGKEHKKRQIRVLTDNNYGWVGGHSNGGVPHNAVQGGRTKKGETLYIGRVHFNGSLTPGKIHPSNRCLYISYNGEEHAFDSYEVLVQN